MFRDLVLMMQTELVLQGCCKGAAGVIQESSLVLAVDGVAVMRLGQGFCPPVRVALTLSKVGWYANPPHKAAQESVACSKVKLVMPSACL